MHPKNCICNSLAALKITRVRVLRAKTMSSKRQRKYSDLPNRAYPREETRARIIESIRNKVPQTRSPDEWYSLGNLLVYEACLNDDDGLMAEGSEALVMAAKQSPPVAHAILDLTWLLNLKALKPQGLKALRPPQGLKALRL